MVREIRRRVHRPARAGLALLIAAGCTREEPRTRSAGPQPKAASSTAVPSAAAAAEPKVEAEKGPVRLRLLITGETQGYLTPCGCTDGMIGGLPRRRSFVESERASSGRAVILLDNGGMVKDNGRQSEIKIDTILASYALMRYAAIVPAGADLSLGPVFSACLENHPGIPLVAANLKSEALRDALAPYRIIRVTDPAGGVARVGVAGILDPRAGPEYGLGEGVRLEDPVEALRAILPALREESDVRILLAHAPKDRARAWAEAVPGFDCVVTGLRQENPPETPEVVGGVPLFHTGTWGKYVIRLDVDLRPSGPAWQYAKIAMEEKIPSDPETNELLVAYQRIIRELGAQGAFLGPRRAHPRDRFIGSSACKDCHESSWDVYTHSKHADGMKTLEGLGVEKDPECIPCHAVGWIYESGFRSLDETPDLAGVGCEECHGPGKKHAENGGEAKLDPIDESTCRRCHTDIQSPEFLYEDYWAK
ncbi:MAG: hypothetical protein JXP34_23945, partial [Planctomycetes bacterium]|nr:hypothetical protein [Planctomycetota bacterium]